MNLNNIKELINELGFSPEAQNTLNEIIDRAISVGKLSLEDKEKMLAIVDIEIASANVQAEALEEVALALDSFINDLSNAQNLAEKDIDNISNNFQSETESMSKDQLIN